MSRKTRIIFTSIEGEDFIGHAWNDENNNCKRKHDMPAALLTQDIIKYIMFKKKFHCKNCEYVINNNKKCKCPVYHFKNIYLRSMPTNIVKKQSGSYIEWYENIKNGIPLSSPCMFNKSLKFGDTHILVPFKIDNAFPRTIRDNGECNY